MLSKDPFEAKTQVLGQFLQWKCWCMKIFWTSYLQNCKLLHASSWRGRQWRFVISLFSALFVLKYNWCFWKLRLAWALPILMESRCFFDGENCLELYALAFLVSLLHISHHRMGRFLFKCTSIFFFFFSCFHVTLDLLRWTTLLHVIVLCRIIYANLATACLKEKDLSALRWTPQHC